MDVFTGKKKNATLSIIKCNGLALFSHYCYRCCLPLTQCHIHFLKKKNPEKVQLYARSEGYPCFDRAGGVLWVQTGRLWCLELLSMRKKLVANFQPDFQMRQLLRIYKKVV